MATQSSNAADHELVIMTFNVLAQCLIKREFYPHCSKQDLKLKFRAPKVIQEILKYDPDIACLQEVDFLEDYGSPLRDLGYDWELQKKSKNGHGLAIIYKTNRFLKIDYKVVNYDEINKFNSSHVIIQTGNMAQIISFKLMHTDTTIIISNTHLYWRPEASAIKIKQAWTLIESLYNFIEKVGDPNATVLLCGDWNIMPQDILYRLLTRSETVSQYELEHVFEKNMDHGSEDNPAACEKIVDFFPLVPKLRSSYKVFYDTEPPYTTTSKDFTGVLDYIFIWKSEFVLKNVERISEKGDIPNSIFPSDHVPIVATFSSHQYDF